MSKEKKPIPLTYHPPNEWADWPTGEPKGYDNLTPEQQAELDKLTEKNRREREGHGSSA